MSFLEGWRRWLRRSLPYFVGLVTLIWAISMAPGLSQQVPQSRADLFAGGSRVAQANQSALPLPKIHALPSLLATWKPKEKVGDYFDQIKPVSVGYLVWSQFPVTVYVEPVKVTESTSSPSAKQAKIWVDAVLQAVQEWNQYLPLQAVRQPAGADITILRQAPPLRVESAAKKPSTGDRPSKPLIRARTAETHFDLYAKQASPTPLLAHRFTILLRPDQAPLYTLATARHELGHALGIWGHSLKETDALYFSQVRNPPLISPRDVNTLKRVYEQPTSLGWTLP